MKTDSRPLTPAAYVLVALGFVAAAVLFDVATEHVLAGQFPPWQTRVFTAVASALALTWALRWGDQRLRRVAAESRQSRERARRFQESLLDALPVGVFFKDREGRYIGCNAHFTEVLGLTEDDIRGKTVSDLWPTELAATYRRKDEELMRSPQVQHYEFKLIDKEGRIRDVVYSKGPLYDERGEVAGLVGGFFDISDHKCALNALAASERKFRTLFESAQDAIMLLDETGFLHCNPATAQVMGLPCDQLIGRSPTEFAPEMQPSGERSAAMAARRIAAAMAGQPQRFEWRAKRADGELTDHEVVGRDLGPNRNESALLDAKLRELALGLDLGHREISAIGLGQVLRLAGSGAELQGHVAVLVLGPVGDNLTLGEPQHRHRHVLPGVREDACHAHLLRDHSGTHVPRPRPARSSRFRA